MCMNLRCCVSFTVADDVVVDDDDSGGVYVGRCNINTIDNIGAYNSTVL